MPPLDELATASDVRLIRRRRILNTVQVNSEVVVVVIKEVLWCNRTS